jgi:hypothetical protein
MGGEYRREREYAHAQFLEAAAEEGGCQAEAFEWLGHWYAVAAEPLDEGRARRCYQRALALNPGLVRGGRFLVMVVWGFIGIYGRWEAEKGAQRAGHDTCTSLNVHPWQAGFCFFCLDRYLLLPSQVLHVCTA